MNPDFIDKLKLLFFNTVLFSGFNFTRFFELTENVNAFLELLIKTLSLTIEIIILYTVIRKGNVKEMKEALKRPFKKQ